MSTESEIAKLIGTMAMAFPSAKISGATIEVYVSMLRDVPVELLRASVQQCMAESEFLPTIAKLREKALELSSPVAPEPMEAWGIVLKEMSATGFYRSPKFDNPIIAKAVDCIGWKALCSSENAIADRAHFAKVYEGLLRLADNNRRTLPIARQIRESAQKLIEGREL